ADRLARGQGRDPLLDPRAPDGAPRAHDPQAPMTTMTLDRPSSTLLEAPRGRGWRDALAGRSVTVVGLARSGAAACRLLLALGARVTGTDARVPEALTPEARALETDGVRLLVEGHPPEAFRAAELVIVSPWVPTDHPALAACRARGVPVLGEIELAYRTMTAEFVAITGTNGKPTTTALTGALLAESRRPILLRPNIPPPLPPAPLHLPPHRAV